MTNHTGSRILAPAALVAVTAAAGCTAAQPVASAPSSVPGRAAPAATTTTARPTGAATRPTSERPDDGCPVTAATLDRVPGLPDGYRINPDTVQCWKDWATGWDRNQQGDGMYLFRYGPSRGWRIHGQGSAFDCAALGSPKDPDDPPPFCS
jgi:hypothetical protein